MTLHERLYRAALHLYPKEFRTAFADDLAQHFADLVADVGIRRAWSRTLLDLIVTVPRYRLETMMNPQQSSLALNLILIALVAVGIMSILTGLYPGSVLLLVAAVIAVTQRSKLAHSLRPIDPSQRRKRLTLAALLVAVVAGSIGGFFAAVNDGEVSGGVLIAYNAVGVLSLIGAVVALVAGLRSPASNSVATE